MNRRRVLVVAVVGIVAFGVAPQALAAKQNKKLNVSFGPGLTFIVKRGDATLAEGSNGKARVKAGNYAIKFDDNATFHNVRLQNAKGKTVKATKRKAKTTTRKKTNFRTSVPGTSKGTFKLKLRPGRYTLLCDPHRTLGMTVTLIVRK